MYEPSISNSYSIQTSYTLTHVVCSWEFDDLIFKFQKYLFIHIFSEIQTNWYDVFLSGKCRPIPIFYNHLAKQFQRRRFLEINQPETKIAYGSHVCYQIGMKLAIFIKKPSIDVSYQVSVQLTKQGRRFLEIDQSERRIACSSHVC